MYKSISNDRVVFVVGASRSGTTMLGRVLGNNSKIHTIPEIHFIGNIVSANDFFSDSVVGQDQATEVLSTALCRSREGYWNTSNKMDYEAEAQQIMSDIPAYGFSDILIGLLRHETMQNAKDIPCKQTPFYLEHIERLSVIFPNARFIMMVRDPHDVSLSQKNRWKRSRLSGVRSLSGDKVRSWINYHPILVSMMWNSSVKKGRVFHGRENVKLLKYEDLVLQNESSIKALCEFIGVEFESGMLDVPKVGSSHGVDSGEKGMAIERVSAWKRNKDGNMFDLTAVSFFTKKNLLQFNYDSSYKRMTPTSFLYLFFSVLTLFVKVPLIFFFNLSSLGAYWGTIKRRFL